ncbi:DUF4962 domain-containing protein [Brevibacillus sp. B_LB10_24]|uniref:DUF4962 domain-containing protein n=1 Tax=Brevibacillus sp. B_LB10_24 TaxID=3380645 RepID=UPI0038BD1AE8
MTRMKRLRGAGMMLLAAAVLLGTSESYQTAAGKGETEPLLRMDAAVPMKSGASYLESASARQILQDLKRRSPNRQHPRLMATADQFEQMKVYLKTDKTFKKYFDDVKWSADKILSQPAATYQLKNGKLLETSDLVLDRVLRLALMYRLTHDKVYADRAWKELRAVCDDNQFKDWNPPHFLDVAEMSNAVAIGYDWLYDYLSDSQKKTLRSALMRKGLEPALEVYRGNTKGPVNQVSWLRTEDNWNTVVNAGIGVGALAIADETPETEQLSSQILEYAIRNITVSLGNYAPDGGSPEGPGYWDHGTLYISYFLSSLDSALGTDYGLSDAPGLSETGYYPLYVTGPAGSFNLGDADFTTEYIIPQQLWLAGKYGKPELLPSGLQGYGMAMKMVWYKPADAAAQSVSRLPLDKRFSNPETEIVTMRSKWNDPNALFVGFHAGDNYLNHADLDIGTFVLDALGVRWATELGKDNYDLPGYFDIRGQRWDYYRKRAEGQNTLVINPGSGPDQNIHAKSTIDTFKTSAQGAFAITDMTSAYERDAVSAKRGIALVDNRTKVLLQDEVQLKRKGYIWWFMHTDAKISLADDGRSAILQVGDKRLWAHILSDQKLKFRVFYEKPLSTSPNPPNQAENKGLKLAILSEGASDLRLSVLFVPLREGEKPPATMPEIKPLKDWSTTGFPVRLQ